MKTYYQLTKEEQLALTGEELADVIKVTAIESGMKVPMKFSEALNAVGYTGFTLGKNTAKFYEICTPGSFSGHDGSGIAFSTEQEALNFLENNTLHFVEDESFNSKAVKKLIKGDPVVRVCFVGAKDAENYACTLDKAMAFKSDEDAEAYENLCKEITEAHSELRQDVYNAQVRWEKRQEFLRLANGDETIARAFWDKSESGEFPPAEEPILKIK